MRELKQNFHNNPWLRPAIIFLVRTTSSITVLVIIGFFGGKIFDNFFSTQPFGIIFGTVISFGCSIWSIFKALRAYEQSIE